MMAASRSSRAASGLSSSDGLAAGRSTACAPRFPGGRRSRDGPWRAGAARRRHGPIRCAAPSGTSAAPAWRRRGRAPRRACRPDAPPAAARPWRRLRSSRLQAVSAPAGREVMHEAADRADRGQRLAAEAQGADVGRDRRRAAWRCSGARPRAPAPRASCRRRRRPPRGSCGRPPSGSTAMRWAPASIAFSTSSLTALAGRSTTSPAAMRLTRFEGRRRSALMAPPFYARRRGERYWRVRILLTSGSDVMPTGLPTTTVVSASSRSRRRARRRTSSILTAAIRAARLVEMVGRQVVDLHGMQQARDGARRIERQRQRAGEIGLGVGELLLGRAVDAKPRQLGLDHAQRLGDALVGRLPSTITSSARALVDAQARGGAVGQAALLAHLGEQPRLLAAAAQDVVHDQGGVPVGIVARDAGQGQQGGALRHRPLDHDGARLGGRLPLGRQRPAACRPAGCRRRGRAGARDRPRRCRRPPPRPGRCGSSRAAARCLRVCCVSFLQVVGRAVGIVGIGMAGELGRHQRAPGDRGRTLVGLVDRGDGLGAPLLDHVADRSAAG